jgi:ketosteroid isomerase-like protein
VSDAEDGRAGPPDDRPSCTNEEETTMTSHSRLTSDSMMAVVRRLFEDGWNSGKAAAVADIVHDDYESNDGGFFASGPGVPGGLEPLTGVDAFAKHLSMYAGEFDDLEFTVERMLADGDGVVTVWTATGRSTHETIVSRAGKVFPVELNDRGVSTTELAGGKIRRHDMYWRHGPFHA